MNPSVDPDVRDALIKEAERRSTKTGKKITALQLKADKFYDRRRRPHRGAPGLLEGVRGEGGEVPLQQTRLLIYRI
jgi:hypothetical protein